MKVLLNEIIKKSTFEIVEGSFIYSKVKSYPKTEDHFLIAKDNDEITVVTKAENLDDLDLVERNKDDYSLIALNVSIPFYCVGFLATVSSEIAKAGLNILIISTYSKDYIMMKQEKIKIAKNELLKLGFKEKCGKQP